MEHTEKRGRGRPPKAADEKAEERIELRIPTADKAEWQASAERAELKLSAWIRDRLNKAAKREARQN
jgi:predicted HicB family RNase H-like nuclease